MLVVDDLRKAGVSVSSTQDLMHTRERYPEAIPVLLEWLPRLQTFAMREVVVRSLGTKGAKGVAGKLLVREFERSLQEDGLGVESLRWAIANTLEILGGAQVFEDLAHLVRVPGGENANGMLLLAAAKTKDPRAVSLLLPFLEDPDLRPFAARGLGLIRAKEAIPKILELAQSGVGNAWQRREFRTALKRLGVDF